MKTIEEIINQEPVFLNNFDSTISVLNNFHNVYMTKAEYEALEAPYVNVEAWIKYRTETKELLNRFKDIKILFASYGSECYEGDAWVLFEDNGNLFEVSGGHCSCYGLEGQWDPESVVLKELENRLTKGTFGTDNYSGNNFATELKQFLGI